jgi:hypothetical protein
MIATGLLALSPALSAVRSTLMPAKAGPVSLEAIGSISSFTPVTNDPRLAKAYARAASNAQRQGFRFTPASGATSGQRAMTVLVRAPLQKPGSDSASSSPVSITPVAYSLGSARGLQGLALAEAGTRRALDPIISDIARPDMHGFRLESPRRFSADVRLDGKAPVAAPEMIASQKTYAVDVGSRFALTRNLDVRAGVRYRSPLNRESPLTDEAQDSQAVYVGTAFKF